MIRQAVLLCAGLGTRLRPFTDKSPKPMLPILGIPLIEWNIRRLVSCGVTSFLINLHYLPDVLTRFLGDGGKWGAEITYSHELQVLGTAGGVKAFEPHLDDEFFVMYGDIFSDLDYAAMELAWRTKHEALGMQTVSRTDDYTDADVAELGRDGRVVAVHPKPHIGQYVNAYRMRGVFILKRSILTRIASGRYAEIGKDLIPAVLAGRGAFYGYEAQGYSKGIDTVQKWKEVEEYLVAKGHEREGTLPRYGG